jgi:hypothetical protein
MPLSPRTLRPSSSFTPRSLPGLALWLDGSDATSLYTTDAGPVTAVSSPTEISGCELWLDGADSSAASMTLSGSFVTAWKDKSGNGRDVSATGGDRPTLTSNYYGSTSALTFSGSNVMALSGGGLPFGPCTSFVVFDETTAVNYAGLLVGSPSSGNDYDQDAGFSLTAHEGAGLSVMRWGWKVNFAAGTALVSDSEPLASSALGKRLAAFTIGSSTAQCYMSGMVSGSADSAHAASGASSGIIVGGRYISGAVSAAYRFTGKICEIIHFNTALSTADRARVEAYLAQRWGISGVHAPAVNASDPVGYWRDKSGNNRHATQGTGASRPTISGTAFNSRKALAVDTTKSLLSSASVADLVASPSSSPAATLVFVAISPSGAAGFSCGSDNAANGRLGVWLPYDTSGNSYFDVGGTGTGRLGPFALTAANQSVASVYVCQRNGIDMTVRRNGATLASKSGALQTFSATSAKLQIGQAVGLTGFQSTFSELICYSSALSSGQVASIERHLAAKYGITLAPKVSNADAQDWINRVYANGGTVSASTAAAVNTLCDSLDASGVRPLMYRMGIFSGTGLAAALVPLYRGPAYGGATYGDATDTNNNFVSGDYAETGASGGLTGNGTSKYLQTGFAGNTLATGNRHLSAYESLRDTGAYRTMIGTQDDSAGTYYWSLSNASPGTTVFAAFGAQASSTGHNTGGHWIATDPTSSSLALYKNGLPVASSTSAIRQTPSVRGILVFATNQFPGSVSPSGYTAARLNAYSIGLGMTSQQASDYYTAMQTFQTALGRNV